MKRNPLLLFLLLAGLLTQAQKLKKEDRQLVANLEQHVRFLADDKLEGRRTGSPGEKLAAAYISAAFQKSGLEPKGTSGYFQDFEINEGKVINPGTFLNINGKSLVPNRDFFPLAASPNLSVEALPSMALQEPGMPWFFDLKDLLEEGAGNPHFDLEEAIDKSTREVKRKGATAIFLYNSSNREDGLSFNGKDRSAPLPIPVIYLSRSVATTYLSDPSATLDLKFKVDIGQQKRTGLNVIGFLNNGAPHTVVIGAHYDHLGYGEDGNGRSVDKTRQIYNGADDNASGTAALIEMASLLKGNRYKGNNYLFIAFSGEELGLYGSKNFTEHPTLDLGTVSYMINMDMIGRLNDSAHALTVGGYGTSPFWGMAYAAKGKKKLYDGNLAFRFDSSGTGPSDHTSFYLKNIPVLFYFTGLHADYHKPTDDFEKINYTGEAEVIKHILSLIAFSEGQKEKLAFTKTRETQTGTTARFSVTLGIMPDYTYGGTGVRVDGVSENRPAQKAGLQTGDVITSLGGYRINSLESYMQALSRFHKGDKAKVEYTRGSQALSSTVEF